jgi:hypothetical protein
MHGLDVFRMVISPSSSHTFRVPVVRYDVAVICKFFQADDALPVLLGDLSVQQPPHLSRRPEFAIPSGVVGIFDTLNAKLKSAFFPCLLAAAAEQRAVDWTIFVATEFHGNAPV